MATTKKKTVKVSKPRAKKAEGEIKVTRARTKDTSEHVLDLGGSTITPAPDMSIRAIDPYGDDPVSSPKPVSQFTPVSLFDDPVVRQTIDDKVGGSGRWPFAVYKRIAVTFVVLAILSLAAVAYVTFVRLDIAITPAQKQVEAASSFKVYDRPADYELPEGSALGMVRNMEVEYVQTVPATGTKATGAEVTGTVTIINNYNKAQPLVATTRLLTPNNQILRLKDTVTVPAGGQVEVAVYATDIDPSFTLADARLTIPGLWAGLQDKIYAEVKRGAVTYKEQAQGIVTQKDIDEATRLGKIAIVEKAKSDIEAAYGAYTKKLYQLDEASLIVSPETKVGDEITQAKVKVSATVVVVAFNEAAIKTASTESMTAATPDQNQVAETAPATYSLISADTNDNVAEVKVLSSVVAIPKSDAEIVDRSKLILLTRDQLEAYLNSRPEIESFELKFTPSFWPLTPQFSDKITVTIKE